MPTQNKQPTRHILDTAFLRLEQEEATLSRPHFECRWKINEETGEITHHCRIEKRSWVVNPTTETEDA